MVAEIERKFLVSELPPPPVLGPGAGLRQGYLAEEAGVEVRVRIADGEARLTVKAGSGLTRTEVEISIAAADAEALWPLTAGRRVEKRRHRVHVDGGVAEVDVYGGALAGLVVVEVEFDDREGAARFVPPAWFGEEVTGNPAWSNASLARSGRPRDP